MKIKDIRITIICRMDTYENFILKCAFFFYKSNDINMGREDNFISV